MEIEFFQHETDGAHAASSITFGSIPLMIHRRILVHCRRPSLQHSFIVVVEEKITFSAPPSTRKIPILASTRRQKITVPNAPPSSSKTNRSSNRIFLKNSMTLMNYTYHPSVDSKAQMGMGGFQNWFLLETAQSLASFNQLWNLPSLTLLGTQ